MVLKRLVEESEMRHMNRRPEFMTGPFDNNGKDYVKLTWDEPNHAPPYEGEGIDRWGTSITWDKDGEPVLHPAPNSIVEQSRGANTRFEIYIPLEDVGTPKHYLVKSASSIQAPARLELPTNTTIWTIILQQDPNRRSQQDEPDVHFI